MEKKVLNMKEIAEDVEISDGYHTFTELYDPGLVPVEPDSRDHSYGAIFGEEASLPRKFILDMPTGMTTPYQGQVPSCVSCAFTFANEFNSRKNDGNDIVLSFRKIHADTGAYKVGRSIYQVAEYEKGKGQPQTKYCPNNVDLPAEEFMRATLTPEGIEDASKRKIGPYSFLDVNNRNELMSAIFNGPVVFTAGGNNTDWRKEIIRETNPAAWYHAFVGIGWDLDKGVWYIKNWWNDGIRMVDINYSLTGALSFRDLPDGEKNQMIKTVRVTGKNDVYAISGNQKCRVPDSDTLHYFLGQLAIFSETVEITQAELDGYAEGETVPSIKFMRALQPICADIFLNEQG